MALGGGIQTRRRNHKSIRAAAVTIVKSTVGPTVLNDRGSACRYRNSLTHMGIHRFDEIAAEACRTVVALTDPMVSGTLLRDIMSFELR